MKMTEDAVRALLAQAPVAHLATTGADGAPYVVPVHFACVDGKAYVHGKPAGRKIENIRHDPRVCIAVHEMHGLLLPDHPNPCRTNTAFHSAVITGRAAVLTDPARKHTALRAIADKYTPQLADQPIPMEAVAKTAVIEITMDTISGKYYE